MIQSVTDPQSPAERGPDRQVRIPSPNLGLSMERLASAVNRGLAEEAADFNLTLVEFNLLSQCLEDESGECTATQLAEMLPVDASRISRIVTKLVDKGLLLRRRLREDRRIVMLRLSDEGMSLVLELRQHMQAYMVSRTGSISAEEMRLFESVTARLLNNHWGRQQSA